MTQRAIPCLILCAAALAACSSAASDWSRASEINTLPAYQQFLSRYPNDAHATEARDRIAALRDDQAWNAAQIASSLDGYRQYLTTEPKGAHAGAAQQEIVSLQRAADWRAAQIADTADALQGFITRYPDSTEADAARDKLKTLTGYRAELSTAHSEKAANRERDKLAQRFGKNLPQLVVIAPSMGEHTYEIASAPMSQQDATAACASVRHAGQSCSVVQTSS
jgi:hypothetical protein